MKNEAREIIHSFGEFYKILFKDFKPKNLLEIGTYEGAGIWYWHKMFPDIEITSVDIKKYNDFEVPAKTTLLHDDIKRRKKYARNN